MVIFVLVHGSCHGVWCWKKVIPLLNKDGHGVYTPTLTGLGERSHLVSRVIGLDTHVLDIIQVLKYENLNEVMLVGHSYGGLVIGGVAEKVPETSPETTTRLLYIIEIVFCSESLYYREIIVSESSTILHSCETSTRYTSRFLALIFTAGRNCNHINNSQFVKLMTDDDMPNIVTLSPSQNGSIC